jgi:translation initiation factor IF-2
MLNEIKDELTKRIPSTEDDLQTGCADVLQTFDINERNKKIPVAGCRVVDGSLEKKQLFKLVRQGQVIHRGLSLLSLSLISIMFIFFRY